MIPADLTILHCVNAVSTIPWLVQEAIEYLDGFLTKDMDMFEWGAGGSTRWFALRVNHITSVEHAREWYERVLEVVPSNTTLCFTQDRDEYIGMVTGTYDVILIDGEPSTRIECLNRAVSHLQKDGILICDDFGWKEFKEGREILKDWNATVFNDNTHTTMIYRRKNGLNTSDYM